MLEEKTDYKSGINLSRLLSRGIIGKPKRILKRSWRFKQVEIRITFGKILAKQTLFTFDVNLAPSLKERNVIKNHTFT